MDKKRLKGKKIKYNLNEKIIFNKKTAKQTSDIILKTESYVVNINKTKENWIKLPDGSTTPCYCNCRYINRNPKATKIIGNEISKMIKNKFPNVELIIGLETAGISWASKVAMDLQLPFAYARGKSKGYGQGKLIECNPPKNLKTVIIDDAYFTGESVIKAIEATQNEIQGEILGIGVIINLSNLNNNENYLNFSKQGVFFYSLTNYNFILKELKERKQINNPQFLKLKKFYNNPKKFSWN